LTPPNVLFLVVDSLRADVVFTDRVGTPNLSALARRGTAFTQCVCTSTTTTPSFSSMLTGCYPPKHGVRGLEGYTLSSELRTMPESFKQSGYTTYAEVTGPLLPPTGVLRGFDNHRHRQAYRVPFFGWRDHVVAAMRTYTAPWFLLLHIWEVHKPYRAPPDFAKRDDKAGYEAAVAASDEWLAPVFEAAGEDAVTIVTGDHGEDYMKSFLQAQAVRQSRRARRYLKVGRWLPPLDRRLASAEIGHGFSLDEHHVRVPLIVAGPGVPARRVDDQVRHVDLLPTLAELCELETPLGIDGRSIVPLMRGQELVEEPAYMEAVGVKLGGDRIVGARIPGYKLLRRGSGRPKLRRLVEGDRRSERRDVIKDHPEIAARLDDYIARVQATETTSASGMTSEEEAVVEQHLRDLGYL
jgi:Sulfatase